MSNDIVECIRDEKDQLVKAKASNKQSIIDKGRKFRMFIDLWKAFDNVNQELLLEKSWKNNTCKPDEEIPSYNSEEI